MKKKEKKAEKRDRRIFKVLDKLTKGDCKRIEFEQRPKNLSSSFVLCPLNPKQPRKVSILSPFNRSVSRVKSKIPRFTK